MRSLSSSPLAKRRWKNFKANRRAFYSLIIFLILTIIASMAEFVANDKPLIASYRGNIIFPIFSGAVTEDQFGGDEGLIAQYKDPAIQCLIITGGFIDCYDAPEIIIKNVREGLIIDSNSTINIKEGYNIKDVTNEIILFILNEN